VSKTVVSAVSGTGSHWYYGTTLSRQYYIFLHVIDRVCIDLQHSSGGAKVPPNKQLSELSA
jgi:hypothetical protein